jgi:hypothetical protein
MSDTSTKAAKAELLKMLHQAVLNTPGASRVEPVIDTPPESPMRKSRSAPKRVGKIKGAQSASVRKKDRR